jgi:hypothetical protein
MDKLDNFNKSTALIGSEINQPALGVAGNASLWRAAFGAAPKSRPTHLLPGCHGSDQLLVRARRPNTHAGCVRSQVNASFRVNRCF